VLHKTVVNLAAGVGRNSPENPGKPIPEKQFKNKEKKGGPEAAV
jgi:hypothetical protein